MRTRPTLIVVLIAATLGLAGCSSGAYSSADSPQSLPANGGDQFSGAYYDSEGQTDSQPVADQGPRQMITVGSMTVTVDNPITAAAKAAAITEGAGGRVDGRQELAPSGRDGGSATLTLRIPSTRLTSTIQDLKDLGDVVTVTQDSTDVTSQVADVDARVKALRASVDRLTELLATAKNADVLVTIESSLSDRQQQLESMEAQQRALSDQVSLATLTVSFITEEQAPVDEPNTFLTGLEAGWGAFVGFLNALVVAFGVLLPWLVFFGLITVIVLVIVRRVSKRSSTPKE
jgi:hypothetical protein